MAFYLKRKPLNHPSTSLIDHFIPRLNSETIKTLSIYQKKKQNLNKMKKRPNRKKLRIQGGPLVSSTEYQIRVRLRVERG